MESIGFAKIALWISLAMFQSLDAKYDLYSYIPRIHCPHTAH